jgi:hypothetical protein
MLTILQFWPLLRPAAAALLHALPALHLRSSMCSPAQAIETQLCCSQRWAFNIYPQE